MRHPHPNPGDKLTEANQQIARDAIVAADPYVDFAAFDADHDGAVSSGELHIAIIVAGYETGTGDESPSVWAHKSWLYGDTPAPTLDGVIVADYDHGGGFIEIGELMGAELTPIGPVCHELGHDLGVPDLYDRDGSSEGVGIHCLMGKRLLGGGRRRGGWNHPGDPVGLVPNAARLADASDGNRRHLHARYRRATRSAATS